MEVSLVKTADGSDSLFLPHLQEHYHSIYGAVSESMHIFINGALLRLEKKDIRILEIGFGTGLNALLSMMEAEKSKLDIRYHSIDNFRVPDDIIRSINYHDYFDNTDSVYRGYNASLKYKMIHQAPWNEASRLTDYFLLKKIQADVRSHRWQDKYNLCYFDAFAPEKQPELWGVNVFSGIYQSMDPGGILVTYSAKGSIRRLLGGIGFKVSRRPGPEHKIHMTMAVKPV